MCQLRQCLIVVCVAVVVGGFCIAAVQADVVAYREIFPNSTGNLHALPAEGWDGYYAYSALSTPKTHLSISDASVVYTDGVPTNLPAVNSYPSETSQTASGWLLLPFARLQRHRLGHQLRLHGRDGVAKHPGE